jgi:hypothetical protein
VAIHTAGGTLAASDFMFCTAVAPSVFIMGAGRFCNAFHTQFFRARGFQRNQL